MSDERVGPAPADLDPDEVGEAEEDIVAIEAFYAWEAQGGISSSGTDAAGDDGVGGPEDVDGAVDSIDALEDGSDVVVGMPLRDDVEGSDVLFSLTTREHFAALDDPAATGDARIDAATARLAELPDLPTSDHVAIYDDVHRRLQDALADAEVT